jgi:hypothetical protein
MSPTTRVGTVKLPASLVRSFTTCDHTTCAASVEVTRTVTVVLVGKWLATIFTGWSEAELFGVTRTVAGSEPHASLKRSTPTAQSTKRTERLRDMRRIQRLAAAFPDCSGAAKR